MADESKWPFPPTDGGPDSRPLIVDLENVLVAIVVDDDALDRAVGKLRDLGFTDDRVRGYTSEEIVAYDDAFRSSRGLTSRIVGSVVNDNEAMGRYVEYARAGRSALWIRVDDRDDANRVIRRLSDELVFVWYHGKRTVETMDISPEADS